ncbi:MAG: PIG-L family deacetylase [Candidatus Saccharimonadales bacterium]
MATKKSAASPTRVSAIVSRRPQRPVMKWVARHEFGDTYLALAIVVLLVTTVFWSLLGASLNQANADQLVDPYLFSNWSTFHGATFPGAHSFLFKWPLFALISAFGTSGTVLTLVTAAVVLLTVGALAALMYRIERRPLVIGTLFLALSAALLLVPTQPYAGGILPVNMAMLTTRNLEYILFGASLLLLVRSKRFKSRNFIVAAALLTLLIASDKLFLSLSAGGAFLSLVVYAVVQNWRLVTLSVRWLVASGIAGAGAVLLLALINISGLTHIAGESGANPYGFIQDTKDGVLAVMYAILGLFTNFGANPAFDATQLRHLPTQAFRHLLSFSGPAYMVNILVLLTGLVAAWRVGLTSLHGKKPKQFVADTYYDLALMLLWSTLAAGAVFIITNHYYAVDARYVTIGLFALFVAMAVAVRKRKWQPQWWATAGLILLVAILCGITGTLSTHRQSKAALQPITDRNVVLSQVLSRHHVDVLVGDYWRVMPIKFAAKNQVSVAPLSDCTTVRQGLSSTAWQPDLHRHSFAYLISLDKSLTNFPQCSLKQITNTYGNPNTTVLIAGDVSAPKELLLFYDRGIQPVGHGQAPSVFSTIVPIQTGDMRNTSCEGPTTLAIVAHQDDDLLFMNPDQIHDIEAGHCVRTVYLTAGDGGHDKFYWLSREQGSEAAYDVMIGAKKGWLQQTVQLPGKQFMTVSSPVANPKISLLFLHLPDGNLTGHGFPGSDYASLQSLFDGITARMRTVDRQSTYSAQDLQDALRAIMQIYQPAQIRTQATVPSESFPDHSDHIAASLFARKAYEQYEQSQYNNEAAIPLLRYVGYPVREREPNVVDGDLAKKQAAFFAYARFDGAVCYSMRDCSNTPTYWDYLERQYTE